MEKNSDFISSYAYLDSQRLKKTFFSSQPQKKKKSKHPSIFFVVVLVLALLITSGALLFYFNYDFILIPRPVLNAKPEIPSIFNKTMLSSVTSLGPDSISLETKPSFIQLNTAGGQKTGIQIKLKKSINLRTHSLYLIAKKIPAASKIGVVLRDARFFSNWRRPYMITVEAQEKSVIKIALSEEELSLQNINLSSVNQISLYFYPLSYDETVDRIIIKDIVLMEKEEI